MEAIEAIDVEGGSESLLDSPVTKMAGVDVAMGGGLSGEESFVSDKQTLEESDLSLEDLSCVGSSQVLPVD